MRLSDIPYNEYLATRHWQELAGQARKRAEYRCQLCNGNGRLHVHHRTYFRRGRKDEDKDLLVLCERCHREFLGIIPKDPETNY